MEVLAAIRVQSLLLGIAIRVCVENEVAIDRDPPEDEDVDEDKEEPMKEEFGPLLIGYLRLRFLNLLSLPFLAKQALQILLGSLSLHI